MFKPKPKFRFKKGDILISNNPNYYDQIRILKILSVPENEEYLYEYEIIQDHKGVPEYNVRTAWKPNVDNNYDRSPAQYNKIWRNLNA